MSYVIRARYCQPDGIGWVSKDGHIYRDKSWAATYASEADAWLYLSGLDDWWDSDEDGPYYWIELDSNRP